MNIINLTPHAVVILNSTGEQPLLTFPPSGKVARLVTDQKVVGDVSYKDATQGWCRIEIVQTVFSAVEHLPAYDAEADVLYIVSMPVAQALPERKDVVAPDTSRAKRDEDGKIIGVPGFSRY
jgi:uncharacterized protein YuzE